MAARKPAGEKTETPVEEPTAPQDPADRAPVPGAAGFDLAEPITVVGIEWTPDHGLPLASPIGAALAHETAQREESVA